MNGFQPRPDRNQVISASGTSSSVSVQTTAKFLRVCNSGANVVYVALGVGSATASSADTPVLPGESTIIAKTEQQDTFAAQSSGGTFAHVQEVDLV